MIPPKPAAPPGTLDDNRAWALQGVLPNAALPLWLNSVVAQLVSLMALIAHQQSLRIGYPVVQQQIV
jgi:hypothetical protein